MLGFGPLGTFALGQISRPPDVVLTGVTGAGQVGTFTPNPGGMPAVGACGTGLAGRIVPSFLVPNTRRTLANTVRRIRTLGSSFPRRPSDLK